MHNYNQFASEATIESDEQNQNVVTQQDDLEAGCLEINLDSTIEILFEDK